MIFPFVIFLILFVIGQIPWVVLHHRYMSGRIHVPEILLPKYPGRGQ